MQFEDLPALEWSGSSAHVQALAEVLSRPDDLELVIGTLGRGSGDRAIACGAADFTKATDSGELTMLSVHPEWQSLGVGTAMIAALEERVAGRGHALARIAVEHDNPRAAALYARLGYRPEASRLDHWAVGGDRTYVTVVSVLVKRLSGLG